MKRKKKKKIMITIFCIYALTILIFVVCLFLVLKDSILSKKRADQNTVEVVVDSIPANDDALQNTADISESGVSENPDVENTSTYSESGKDILRPVVWKDNYPPIDSNDPLEKNAAIRSSYEETMDRYEQALEIVNGNNIDFSNIKITVLGDSLTEGLGLEDNEKAEYNWPSQLKRILGCKEVVNMGISGSTVENLKHHDPMCVRWKDIEDDNDIIIVMGGTNDALNQEYYPIGSAFEREENTFCGDLSRMLKDIKAKHQTDANDCKLIYINPPLSSISIAYQAMQPDVFLPQQAYADAINEIALSEGFEVIDLYNNNFLNSSDADTYEKLYNIDGLHFNKEGYTIMAYYIAGQIINRIE